MKHAAVLLFFTALAGAQQTPRSNDADNPLAGNAEAIERGRKTYVGSCAACHGATGEGGRGPMLRESRVVRRSSDAQMFQTIRKGIAGTDMPGSNLADTMVWELVALVRSLGSPAATVPLPGNAANGERVYAANGCASCHMISGRGGSLGPDLSNVGGTRSYEHIRESILKPSERIAAGFQQVIARTKAGQTIEGVARNFSNYDVQVTTREGKLYLLKTSDLADLKVSVATPMPQDYAARIAGGDLTDLLAYLGRQSLRPFEPKPVRRGGAR